MPPSEPPRASRSKRRVARKTKPQPPSSEALKGRAYGSRPARALPKPKATPAPRPSAQLRHAAQAAPPGSLARQPGITSRQNPPAAKPQTAAQRARSEEFQHVSQGRAVEHQARSQQRRVYTQLPLANRRHMLQAAKLFQSAPGMEVNEYGKAALQVHHERHAKDVQDEKRFGELPRVAQKNLGAAALKYGEGLPKDTKAGREALNTIMDPAFTAGSDKPSTHVAGTRLGQPDKKGTRGVFDADGKRVAFVAKYTGYKGQKGSVANLPGVGSVVAALGPTATKGLDKTPLPRVIKNIPKDAGELAVTSPTAVVKSISTAVSHPKQEAKALAGEYGKLAKDPKGFISNKPVTAALMLNPLARAPGLAAGKVLRTAGKQTLRRDVATLPGTALREERTGSRAAGRRVVQSGRDKRAAAKGKQPLVTAHQLDQRVDESFAAAQHHATRVRSSMGKVTKTVAKEHPKGSQERADLIESGRLATKGAVKHQTQRSFAKEFGATARVENGRIVENSQATEGHLHSSAEDARAVAEHLNAKVPTIKRGHGNLLSGDPLGRVYAREDVPVKFVVRKVGETKHAVIPEQAAQRLAHHQSVGSTQARGAKILRTSRTMFTRAVLPYRPSWLSGQGIEGAVRSAVKQAGPTSYLRNKRFVKALERQEPGSGKQFLERTSPSGIIGSHQIETPNRTLREEFPGSNVARALTEVGRTPGIKQVRDLNRHVTDFVFNKVNVKALEGVPQTAMLGKVLKDSPLMERKLVGLSNKAMDEAARGGVRPETAASLKRELQKSYGKYEGFSPHTRELISHWTPFLPWYLSTARFLLSTLPKDHPFATALIADMDSATEDWRKQQGLSFRHKENRVPGFMLGGYPIKGKSVVGKALGLKKDETHILRIGHYTPAGIGSDVLGAASGLPLPQFSGFYNATLGLDWKNQPLKHEDGRPFTDSEKFVYGLTQLAEAMVPLSGQVAGVTGVPGMEPPAEDKGEALKKLVRPISTVERKKDKGAKRKKGPSHKRKPAGGNPLLKGGGPSGGNPLLNP